MVMVICETEQRQANASSAAIARFAMTQQPKKSKLKIEDFMPYPNLGKDKKDGVGMQPKTAALLKRLIKQRALPARVEAAAMRDTGVLDV